MICNRVKLKIKQNNYLNITNAEVLFLDASKAFNQLNYLMLFDKLIEKQVTLFMIKLLIIFY